MFKFLVFFSEFHIGYSKLLIPVWYQVEVFPENVLLKNKQIEQYIFEDWFILKLNNNFQQQQTLILFSTNKLHNLNLKNKK